jgi:hypothetical protein
MFSDFGTLVMHFLLYSSALDLVVHFITFCLALFLSCIANLHSAPNHSFHSVLECVVHVFELLDILLPPHFSICCVLFCLCLVNYFEFFFQSRERNLL